MPNTLIIAEIGFNHGGDILLAQQMIDAAHDAGAHVVKFQSFTAGDIALPNAPHFQLIQKGELNSQDHKVLFDYANKKGIEFMSTPFSIEAVDLLEELGVHRYKVASMDATNRSLLAKISQTRKPMVISTGMCVFEEILNTQKFLEDLGVEDYCFLHCQSLYPAEAKDLHLSAIPELSKKLNMPVGYSDHYPGVDACITALHLGAHVIETHFTLDNTIAEGDHSHSANPTQLKYLADFSKFIDLALGNAQLDAARPDRQYAGLYRRGLHTLAPFEAGHTLTPQDVVYCRPANDMDLYDLMQKPHTLKQSVNAFQSLKPTDF